LPKLHYISAVANVGPILARKVNATSFVADHWQNNDLSRHHAAFSSTFIPDVERHSFRAGYAVLNSDTPDIRGPRVVRMHFTQKA
jgi:hypothetical protein